MHQDGVNGHWCYQRASCSHTMGGQYAWSVQVSSRRSWCWQQEPAHSVHKSGSISLDCLSRSHQAGSNQVGAAFRMPTLLLCPTSWLKAHNGGVAPSVVLQQPGHAFQCDRPQGDRMQIGFLVIAGQECCQLSRQLQAFQDLPLGYADIDLQHTWLRCQ